MTPEQCKALHISEALVDSLNETFERFDINTAQRQAAFIGQCGHESGNFSKLQENLNYKTTALRALFGKHRITDEQCEALGRNDDSGQKANQNAIADVIYGGDFGRKNLGNTEEGDGSKFKGRGFIQLTGRALYTKAGEALGEDFANNPDLVSTPRYAMLTAGWFWSTKGCNELADSGDWEALTKKINGGTFGLKERITHTEQALQILSS